MLFATAPADAGDPLAIGPGAIVARVRDEQGKPVGGALVAAEGPAARNATTTAGGVVTLLDLPLGTYDVRVTRPGYLPADARVKVAAGGSLRVTELRVTLGDVAVTAPGSPHRAGDPSPANALATASSIAIVRAGQSVAATLLGTSPDETRYELDGIPLAGGAAGAAALAARDGLGVDAIELSSGPGGAASRPRGAIGGIVNYQTISPAAADGASASAGYASYFGAFEEYRLARRARRLAASFDLTGGDGPSHAQTLKASYAFSPATSIAVASYGLQANVPVRGGGYRLSAPAASVEARTALGRATLRVRAYSSSSSASAYGPAAASALPAAGIAALANDPLLANASLEGTRGSIAVPFGDASAEAILENERERADLASGGSVARAYATRTVRADLRLAPNARVALADAISSGTALPARHDPNVAFSLRAADGTTLRLSAGSSYAVAPPETVAAARGDAALLAPETAFGYRIDVEQPLDARTRAFGAAYVIRARDRFAAFSDADFRGFEFGYGADPIAGRITFDGYLDLERTTAFGSAQPLARYAYAPETAAVLSGGSAFPGDPSSKARVEAVYRTIAGAELRVGNTFFGSNNAFAASGVSLADASLSLPLDPFDLRFGVTNAFGAPIEAPGLSRAFAPHQVTFSLQRVFGAAP